MMLVESLMGYCQQLRHRRQRQQQRQGIVVAQEEQGQQQQQQQRHDNDNDKTNEEDLLPAAAAKGHDKSCRENNNNQRSSSCSCSHTTKPSRSGIGESYHTTSTAAADNDTAAAGGGGVSIISVVRDSILEHCISWTVVIVFGVRYIVDYTKLRIRLSRLQLRLRSLQQQQQQQPHDNNNDDDEAHNASSSTTIRRRPPPPPPPLLPHIGQQQLVHLVTRIPLCSLTRTRSELEGISSRERWKNVKTILSDMIVSDDGQCHGHGTNPPPKHQQQQQEEIINNNNNSNSSSMIEVDKMIDQIPDDDFVRYVHSSLHLRRELSYAMMMTVMMKVSSLSTSSMSSDRMGSTDDGHDDDGSSILSSALDIPQQFVFDKIVRLWSRFLELPPELLNPTVTTKMAVPTATTTSTAIPTPTSDVNNNNYYTMSLIIPMYKEPFENIVRTLRHALLRSRGSGVDDDGTRQASFQIEVVLVHVVDDVVDADSRQQQKSSQTSAYTEQQFLDAIIGTTVTPKDTDGQQQQQQQENQPDFVLKVVEYTGGGGRGPTLNFGFQKSHGQIVTFLHADTLVPDGWDVEIHNALLAVVSTTSGRRSSSSSSSSSSENPFPTACSFMMGIDKSSSSSTTILPAAIRGAEWLGMLRCYCGLPYGDSVLSFRRTFFEYVGGYPNQPLMEDYEIMDWLRTRSLLLKDAKDAGGTSVGESPVLIKTHQALCSPRRWAKHGVAYTSLVNALCIYRYRQLHVPSEDLFNFYYGGQQQRIQTHRDHEQNKKKIE